MAEKVGSQLRKPKIHLDGILESPDPVLKLKGLALGLSDGSVQTRADVLLLSQTHLVPFHVHLVR